MVFIGIMCILCFYMLLGWGKCITRSPIMYVGWKRDIDHPTTRFHMKNSWKLQKGFWRSTTILAQNYITRSRGADSCDVAKVLDIKFFICGGL
jgi:hypothetical protein